MMLHQDQVDAIRRLLAEGKVSQRQIAILTGTSRGTVGAVASGKRLDYEPRPVNEWDAPTGPIVRCPSCGARVYSPCRLCRVRERKALEKTDRRQTAGRDFPPHAEGRNRQRDAHPGENGNRLS